MRKWNAILSAAILVLFLLHAILGSFQLLGLGSVLSKALSWTLAGLIAVHTAIGVKLTVDTLRVRRQTGVGYFKENTLFWARRISGFAIMVLIFFHAFAFSYTADGVTRLRPFDTAKLAAQLLLVLAIAIHVISNVRPMLISFGIRPLKARVGDILMVLSILLLLMAAAFIVYYLRWNTW